MRLVAILLVVLAGSSCRNEANRERQEKRALEETVTKAKDEVHKLNMKELEGGELTPDEVAARQLLKELAQEEENGGDAPEPPDAAAPAAPPG